MRSLIFPLLCAGTVGSGTIFIRHLVRRMVRLDTTRSACYNDQQNL